jgi:pilus assembly protein Flp/PilA
MVIGESVMKKLFVRLYRDDEGQDLIEYALLLGLITVGAVATITTIGGRVATLFNQVRTAIGG